MKSRRHRLRRPELLGMALALLLSSGACSRDGIPASPGAQGSGAEGPASSRFVLFYPAGEDLLLSKCPVTITPSGSPQGDMASLVRRYLAGPTGSGQFQPFPQNSALRALFLTGSEVVVDLSGPVRSGGGSSTETSRVYGIVQTLVFNFPEVKTVRILVDGREVDTLLGHLDLSRPLVSEPRLLARGGSKAGAL